MYNSTLSENKINPTLSLFLVAENAKVAANSVTYSFLKAELEPKNWSQKYQ